MAKMKLIRPIRPHRYAEYMPLIGEDHETPRRYNKDQLV